MNDEKNYEEEQIQGILTENVVTHLSMCSGYEGMGRGLRGIFPNLREIAYVEREGYACANLVAKIEEGELAEAPVFTDVKEFPYGKFRGCVDILSAGFPCQPFSSSGIRKGTEDPRHLFPFIANGINLCRPNWVALENVEGIISCKFGGEQNTSVLKYVLARMEEIGYEGAFTVVSASEEGAPHQRKRVFMLFRNAHPDESERPLGDTEGAGLPSLSSGSGEEQPWRAGTWPARPGQAQHGWEAPRVVMADTEDRENGRDTRVGKEQTESESVISSPRGREDMADTNDGGGEGNSPDGQPKAEDAQPCSDNGDGYSTIEGCIRQSMGNPIDNGHASSEECRGTSKEQEEGRVQESEGGCSEDRTSESSDNVPNSDSCRTSGGRSSQECGDDRDGLHSDTGERDEVRSEAEGCRGEDGELGNTTSERSCGRSENLLGFQPEMFGEGLETTMGNSPSLRSQQEPRVGSEQQASYTSEESGKAEYSREIEPELGRTANGPSSGYYVTPEEMALRVPRLRLLGNGIVPAQAERAYRILFARFINM